MTAQDRPDAASARIEWLDVLRAFALFAIFAVNMQDFSHVPTWHPTLPTDVAASLALEVLFEQKARAMFQLLFGVSFSILLSNWLSSGRPATGRYLRRMGALFAIGLAHQVLLWDNDILMFYAMAGAVLYLFRTARQRTLLIWAASLLGLTVAILGVLVAVAAATGRLDAAPASPDESQSVFVTGGYHTLVRHRFAGLPDALGQLVTAGPMIGALMLVGRWVERLGVIRDPAARTGMLRRWATVGLAVGLPVNVVAAWALGQPVPQRVAGALLLLSGGPLLGVGYLAGLALLLVRPGGPSRVVTRVLAPTGRLTLTNYLGQSAVCTTLFYGYGLGWFGRVGTAAGIGLTLALFALQVVLSYAWTRWFRYGPLEWCWRWATELRRPRLRHPAPHP